MMYKKVLFIALLLFVLGSGQVVDASSAGAGERRVLTFIRSVLSLHARQKKGVLESAEVYRELHDLYAGEAEGRSERKITEVILVNGRVPERDWQREGLELILSYRIDDDAAFRRKMFAELDYSDFSGWRQGNPVGFLKGMIDGIGDKPEAIAAFTSVLGHFGTYLRDGGSFRRNVRELLGGADDCVARCVYAALLGIDIGLKGPRLHFMVDVCGERLTDIAWEGFRAVDALSAGNEEVVMLLVNALHCIFSHHDSVEDYDRGGSDGVGQGECMQLLGLLKRDMVQPGLHIFLSQVARYAGGQGMDALDDSVWDEISSFCATETPHDSAELAAEIIMRKALRSGEYERVTPALFKSFEGKDRFVEWPKGRKDFFRMYLESAPLEHLRKETFDEMYEATRNKDDYWEIKSFANVLLRLSCKASISFFNVEIINWCITKRCFPVIRKLVNDDGIEKEVLSTLLTPESYQKLKLMRRTRKKEVDPLLQAYRRRGLAGVTCRACTVM